MRILAVDPAAVLDVTVDAALEDRGFRLERASGIEAAILRCTLVDFEAILILTEEGGDSGDDVVRKMRAAEIHAPILVLGDGEDRHARIRSLDAGADDVLPDGCDPLELAARVAATTRRRRGFSQPRIQCGPVQLDLRERIAIAPSGVIPLSGTEYRILEILALRMDATVTREVFFDEIYGPGDETPDSTILHVFVCKLRRKLAEATGETKIIETVHGRGYMIRKIQRGESLSSRRAAA
jgi:two-component system, cell cycle response regulator CtrA